MGNAALRLTAGLAVAVLGGCARAAEEPPSLAIDVHARALAPGEPLRVDVVSSVALRGLGGRLLGEPVFLVREAVDGLGERWAGWALVDLERDAGPATLDLRGETLDGRVVEGTRAVTIAAKEFPVERLAVAERFVEPPPEVTARIERERARTRAIYERRRAVPPPREPFVRPVPGEATSTFGTRRLYNGQPRSPHPGLDLRAADGTPVRAAGPGLVALADDLFFSGNTVILDHGGGLFTVYAHLSRIDVAEGQELAAGTALGVSGRTGRVTGPHLHWGAKIGDRPFDPTALLDPELFR